MKKINKLNEQGFGFWEWILLLLLLLLIAFIGWYVWQQNQKNQQSNQPESSVEVKETTDSSTSSVTYLEIPELGIKVQLGDATSDAYYVMQNGYAYISLNSLKNTDECAAEKTGIVAVSKVAKTDTDEQLGETYEAYINGGGNGVIIGDNAYLMNRSQAYCSEDVTVQAQQQAAWDGFLAQAKTMQSL